MRITGLRLRNFRAFRDVELRDMPQLAVFVGANGTGKSTLFSVFEFLREALRSNATEAFNKLGGFERVRSHGAQEPIEIELTLRTSADEEPSAFVTYSLAFDEYVGFISVEREVLTDRSKEGEPLRTFLAFSGGEGTSSAILGDQQLSMEQLRLRGRDQLALKGLATFTRVPIIAQLGAFLDAYWLSDFRAGGDRREMAVASGAHLSTNGENLPLVVHYLQRQHPQVLEKVIERLTHRVPGLVGVHSRTTEDGSVQLEFLEGTSETRIPARQASEGTLKMLAYLVLLLDPNPHPFLCVEEPESHLYHTLLTELAEELRVYSIRGGQVMVTSHSPDFLNAIELDEVYWLVKRNGATEIRRGRDNEQVAAYMTDGGKLGWLWKEGFFSDVEPQ